MPKLHPEDQKIANQVVEALREYEISEPLGAKAIDPFNPPPLFHRHAILTLAVCVAFGIDPVILGTSLVQQAVNDPSTRAILESVRGALEENVKSN